jgi:hypothetical protein
VPALSRSARHRSTARDHPVAATIALARKEKQPARAVAAADLLADNAKGPADLYTAACGHALCVPLADKPQTKDKYAARSVELLRKAVAKGYKDAAQMKTDADLDALRQRDDFQKLLADLEAVRRTGPGGSPFPGPSRRVRIAAPLQWVRSLLLPSVGERPWTPTVTCCSACWPCSWT